MGLSLTKLLDYIAEFSETETGYIELSINRLYSFRDLLDKAIQKLLMARNYREFLCRSQKCNEWERESIKIFLEYSEAFECCKISPCIRGPCGLSYDFYLDGGSFRRNSYFLFGTASQFRISNGSG